MNYVWTILSMAFISFTSQLSLAQIERPASTIIQPGDLQSGVKVFVDNSVSLGQGNYVYMMLDNTADGNTLRVKRLYTNNKVNEATSGYVSGFYGTVSVDNLRPEILVNRNNGFMYMDGQFVGGVYRLPYSSMLHTVFIHGVNFNLINSSMTVVGIPRKCKAVLTVSSKNNGIVTMNGDQTDLTVGKDNWIVSKTSGLRAPFVVDRENKIIDEECNRISGLGKK